MHNGKREGSLKDKLYVNYEDGMHLYSLGRSTLERLAKESGSMIKIGKRVLIDRNRFENYLETFRVTAEEGKTEMESEKEEPIEYTR